MAKFTDNLSREHVLEVTIDTLLQVRKQFEFDLTKLLVAESAEHARVVANPIFLCELTYFISQLEKPEDKVLEARSFYKALAGDALERALEALIEAIVDFSPRPEARAFLRNLKEKVNAAQTLRTEMAMATLNATSTEDLVKMMDTASRSESSASASSSPAEPASTPAAAPSAS